MQHHTKLLAVGTVARELLGVGPRTLYRLIAAGALPVVRIGRRVLIEQGELDRFIERSRTTREPTRTASADNVSG
jgi:excisionase family DNA binding protein